MSNKLTTKYQKRINKFFDDYSILEEDWESRIFCILNYWEGNLELDEIIEENEDFTFSDYYNANPLPISDFYNVFEVMEKHGMMEIDEEEKNRQKRIIDAIT